MTSPSSTPAVPGISQERIAELEKLAFAEIEAGEKLDALSGNYDELTAWGNAGRAAIRASRHMFDAITGRDLAALCALARGATEDGARLAKFGALVLEESRKELGDLDGGWLQDTAIVCDVLEHREMTRPCDDGDAGTCRCIEYGFPVTCYRYAPGVAAAIAAARSLPPEPTT